MLDLNKNKKQTTSMQNPQQQQQPLTLKDIQQIIPNATPPHFSTLPNNIQEALRFLEKAMQLEQQEKDAIDEEVKNRKKSIGSRKKKAKELIRKYLLENRKEVPYLPVGEKSIELKFKDPISDELITKFGMAYIQFHVENGLIQSHVPVQHAAFGFLKFLTEAQEPNCTCVVTAKKGGGGFSLMNSLSAMVPSQMQQMQQQQQ